MHKIILNILLLLITFSSCEKVIEIKLEESSRQIIIEGLIDDLGNPPLIKINRTVSFSSDTFDFVGGAVVIINDDIGNVDTLFEINRGIYISPALTGTPGHTYYLKVEIEGETYESTCRMPERQLIDSIGYVYNRLSDPFTEPGYKTACYFTNKSGSREYFRLRYFINRQEIYGFNLASSGGGLEQYIFGDGDIINGDSLTVYLLSVDKEVHSYFSNLERIATPVFQVFTPYNPTSNISNNALGYFLAYSTDSMKAVVNLK
jgi:hypothetical protein